MTVIESRITQLAYAAEIARAMLQRQQATADVASRQLIVEGDVGMVETTIERIEGREIVKFGHLERSDLVTNLMIVLCGDQAAQPMISTTRNQESKHGGVPPPILLICGGTPRRRMLASVT